MVRIAFNSALALWKHKALWKAVPTSETDPELASAREGSERCSDRCLLTVMGIGFILNGLIFGGACLYTYFNPKDPELASAREGSERYSDRCLLTVMGIAFILSGLIFGGACLYYRYFNPKDPELASAREGSEGCSDRCLLTVLGIAFILSGLVFGACPYRYFNPKCSLALAEVAGENQPCYLPRSRSGDPAFVLRDFDRELTAYLYPALRACFVMSVVLPPQDLMEHFKYLTPGSHRSYVVQEDLVVTERIDDMEPLGPHISELCDGTETYRVQPRSELPGGRIQKPYEEKCFTIHHLVTEKFVIETRICKA